MNKKDKSMVSSLSVKLVVMSSITLTLCGNESTLSASFHPEIELDDRFSYSCGLLDFYTYNSIPNVHEGNNQFMYVHNGKAEIFEIPVGSYEIDEIANYLNRYFETQEIVFIMRGNKNTLRCLIKCDPNLTIDFTIANSIGPLLGFSSRVLENRDYHISDKPVNITHITSIRVDCDITTGSFHNGRNTHTLYEFSPSVSPGYKISEQPRNLIYLPVVRRRINTINVAIVDQDGHLVDFRGEGITCRIHIKRDT